MGKDVKKPLILNLGCGPNLVPTWVNVDYDPWFKPDVEWDLNQYPWPWDSMSVDGICASHIFEHLDDWWTAFKECVRILKPFGHLEVHVPDFMDTQALTPRGHKSIISIISFSGVRGVQNEWRKNYPDFHFPALELPVRLVSYERKMFHKYHWMPKWLKKICANNFHNFVEEQRFYFERTTR